MRRVAGVAVNTRSTVICVVQYLRFEEEAGRPRKDGQFLELFGLSGCGISTDSNGFHIDAAE